jgi:predicted MFS family arabinose efflux permease
VWVNALRGWAVAFHTYVAISSGGTHRWVAATVVTTAMGLIGTWASRAGNEASVRLGRERLAPLAMTGCVICAAAIGFIGARSYLFATVLVLVYGLLIWLDSSSLTTGSAGSADPARRGATLALHSMAGYAGSFVGLLMIGWVLDRSGGMSPWGWGLAFLHVGTVGLLGQLAFVALRPGDLAGDRSVGSDQRRAVRSPS